MKKAKIPKQPDLLLPPNKETLQAWIEEALAGGVAAPEFVARLAAKGVKARPNLASTGRLSGFSFALNGFGYSGSHLGRDYTLTGLIARGLSYDPGRDAEVLRQMVPVLKSKSSPALPQPNTRPGVDEIVRKAIDWTLRCGPQSAVEFVDGLSKAGVQVTAALTTNGRLSGFRFMAINESRKGSDLGFDYTLTGLVERGLQYDPGQAVALKVAMARPAALEQSPEIEDASWPDAITPDPAPYSGKRFLIFSNDFRLFTKEESLLYWRNINTQEIVFYHRNPGPKKERRGLAYVDRGEKIDVRIASDRNILSALKYAVYKWGAVKIIGDSKFIARGEALAAANGICLGESFNRPHEVDNTHAIA